MAGVADRHGLGAPKTVFGKQTTHAGAVIEYLRRDFAGVFEFDDLDFEGEFVWHRSLPTRHMHYFSTNASPDERRTEYPAARAKHDALCAATRALLTDKEATLFLFGGALEVSQRVEIEAEIAARNPRRPFRLVTIDVSDRPPSYDGDDGWQGNHEAWDAALASHNIDPLHRQWWFRRRRIRARA